MYRFGKSSVLWFNQEGELCGPCDFIVTMRHQRRFVEAKTAKNPNNYDGQTYRIFISKAEMKLLEANPGNYVIAVRHFTQFNVDSIGLIRNMDKKIKDGMVICDKVDGGAYRVLIYAERYIDVFDNVYPCNLVF